MTGRRLAWSGGCLPLSDALLGGPSDKGPELGEHLPRGLIHRPDDPGAVKEQGFDLQSDHVMPPLSESARRHPPETRSDRPRAYGA